MNVLQPTPVNNQPKPCRPLPGGHLFILSAPSGAGKTTLRQALLNHFPDLIYSVSYTTRKPRDGEQAGVDYHFITRRKFEQGIATNRWAEWATVHGNYYGTSAQFLNYHLAKGHDLLLDIDVQGTQKILQRYPQAITIFINPPTLEVLRKRLECRSADSAEEIALRLENARTEMARAHHYRHVIVNDQLADALSQLASIIDTYRPNR